MILEKEHTVLPVCSNAFTVTQSCYKELNETYRGAIVTWKNGQQAIVEHIDIQGFYGDSFLSKVRSTLFGVKSISVQFTKSNDVDLALFKKIITKYITQDNERGEPYFELKIPIESVCNNIADAADIADIFEIINMPAPQGCLDVL